MLPATYATPAAIVLALGGLITCFAGYRLFRFVLGINGFILGVMVASQDMAPEGTMKLVMVGIAGGVAGAILMYAAYFMGVGLIGAGLAALALNLVWRFVGGEPPTVVLVVVCVLGALGALSVQRWVVIVGTSIAGALTLIVGASALMGDAAALRAAAAGNVWVVYPLAGGMVHRLVWFGLALAGAVVQMSVSKKAAKAKFKR